MAEYTDKPLLTEWRDDGDGGADRFLAGTDSVMTWALRNGGWAVYKNGENFAGAKAIADAVARQWFTLPEDAERAPAPSVEEVINGLLWHADHIASGLSVAQVNLDKLRAFLSALPDEARRVGMAGMKGGK